MCSRDRIVCHKYKQRHTFFLFSSQYFDGINCVGLIKVDSFRLLIVILTKLYIIFKKIKKKKDIRVLFKRCNLRTQIKITLRIYIFLFFFLNTKFISFR